MPVFDVCESHMWISRCFKLIFTTIKTKNEMIGSDSNGWEKPHSKANTQEPVAPSSPSGKSQDAPLKPWAQPLPGSMQECAMQEYDWF